MTLATRIGVLNRGRLVQIGTPREIYEEPANTYVATRLGSPGINLLPRAMFPDGRAAGRHRSGRGRSIPASARPRTAQRSARSPGSSISAIRTTCMSRSGSDDLVTLADPESGLRSATRSPSISCGRCSSTPPAIGSRRDAEDRHENDGPGSATQADRGGGDGCYRPRRRADRARSGDRRRRSRHQHEARLRGSARRHRRAGDKSASRCPKRDRHGLAHEGRWRVRTALWDASS